MGQDSLDIKEIQNILWGAQTEKAIANFPVSGYKMPWRFIEALCSIKRACAQANAQLGLLSHDKKDAIITACDTLLSGKDTTHFPLDVFQTGSATSTNMNANEVIAHLASIHLSSPLHPNDHVNMSQSSNDVIPSTIAVAALLALKEELYPSIEELQEVLLQRAKELQLVVKTGRTHLMDALPITLGQELTGWWNQIEHAKHAITNSAEQLSYLALGGTAVGTGVNAPAGFSEQAIIALNAHTKLNCRVGENFFELMGAQDRIVGLSGSLRVLAGSLMKIATDLRWMNSGPFAGLSEIRLQTLQPGSSIMPGKVNPVIPESVSMVCAHVFGTDQTIAYAGHHGNFQLNVMLPLIAFHLLENIRILSNAIRLLAQKAIATFEVNQSGLTFSLQKNPIVVTSLNQRIGYDLGAKIAKEVYASGRPVLDVALEMTTLDKKELEELLNPLELTGAQKG